MSNQSRYAQDLNCLVEQQRAYFASGATRDWEMRKKALVRLEHALVERRDALLAALETDLGKPAVEAYLAEYYFLLQELRMIRKSARRWLKKRPVASPPYYWPCRSSVRREPYGAVLVVAPWNYPIQLSLSPLIAAVAAGNTVVLKPSEMAPASEALLVDLITAAFEPEHVAVVTGDEHVADELTGQHFDFIFFTGSTGVGKVVASKAARHLTPCIMELGGKCPCIVDASVHVESAARKILAGKLFNGGQTCFAPDFVVVHSSVKEKLVEAMKTLLEKVPWRGEMARIVNERHFQRLQKLIPVDALQFGDDDPRALRLAPRLVPDAGWDGALMQEEIFGPVLPVLAYADEVDLRAQLGSLGTPLALYIFSEDRDTQNRLMNELASGTVCINDTMKQGSNLNLPFGGVGESGYGRYRGKTSVWAFSYERAVTSRPGRGPDWFELLPPYGNKINWLKRFLR